MPQHYDLFISYAHPDRRHAGEFNDWLVGNDVRTFFDRAELPAGEPWLPRIEAAMASCRAAAILIGRHGLGETQVSECELALLRQTRERRAGRSFPVVPILLPGTERTPEGWLESLTWIDLRALARVDENPGLLSPLIGAIRDPGIPATESRTGVCPYQGLEAFREQDAGFYFGRGAAIQTLFEKVAQHGFVAVVGRSGSGKSSLVFAGLIPRLRREARWDVVMLRPGRWPLHALAAALQAREQSRGGPLADQVKLEAEVEALRSGDVNLVARVLLGRIAAADTGIERLLLYVDQWEELYAQAPSAVEEHARHGSDTERFVELLLAAGRESAIRVVVTVRADFYERVMGHRALASILPVQQMNIPRMDRASLRECIVEPVRLVGMRFEPEQLVERILDDVAGDEAMLPLLQHALKQSWERREGRAITAKGYFDSGGVAHAIASTADETCRQLRAQLGDEAPVRRVFLRLVGTGNQQDDARTRAPIPVDEAERAVVLRFSDARVRLLVTGASDDASGTPTVEIAHEALIRNWETLRSWINANRDVMRVRDAVASQMKDWLDNGRNDSLLIPRGFHLERAKRLRKKHGDVAIDHLQEFIALSVQREVVEIAAENAALQQATLAAGRRSIIRSLLRRGAIAVLVVLATAGLAYLSLRWFLPEHDLVAGGFRDRDRHGLACPECPVMVSIPRGAFMMGTSDELPSEAPPHRVDIAKPFLLGKFEITIGEFRRFIAETGRAMAPCRFYDGGEWRLDTRRDWQSPGWEITDGHPVNCVDWYTASEYVAWLSAKTGRRYRLPTEAEWEYAARAGTVTSRPWGENIDEACGHANVMDRTWIAQSKDPDENHHDCNDGALFTTRVGSYAANAWGVHDMVGNVYEWVQDCAHLRFDSAPVDGSSWLSENCAKRVVRGSSWTASRRESRSTKRWIDVEQDHRLDSIGFRVARDLSDENEYRRLVQKRP